MTETISNFLQSISTTSGFAIFCLVIATAYGSIWYLFLFEPAPKRKVSPAGEKKEQDEEAPSANRPKRNSAQKQPA